MKQDIIIYIDDKKNILNTLNLKQMIIMELKKN